MLMALSCAKQQFPPGGPEDKTPPEILTTNPENISTEISLQPVISVLFSERMNKERTREAIFVSPPPEGRLHTDWKRNDLRISFSDSLSPDRTYLITIGSSATDEHNNRLVESYTLAFSTGETIDSGKISGTVRSNGLPFPGATIVAYTLADIKSADFFSKHPQYMTQSGSDGTYEQGYVSPCDYALFAFDDRNRNKVWDPPQEKIGFPTMPAFISSNHSSATGIDFDLFPRDTVPLRIKDAVIAPGNLLKINLSQVSLKKDIEKSLIILIPEDSPDTFVVRDIYAWEDSAKSFTAVLPDLGDGEALYLQIDSLTDIWGNKINTIEDSILLQSPIGRDKEPPSVDKIMPLSGARNVPLFPAFRIRFTEPVKLISDTVGLWLVDPDSVTIPCEHQLLDIFTISFKPSDTLKEGTNYEAVLDLGIVSDIAGNRFIDSTFIFRFSTTDRDSLGAFSGKIVLGKMMHNRLPNVYFSMIPKGKLRRLECDSLGRFYHEVAPGKYRFVGFDDRNSDGYLSTGRLSPFRYAEPVIFFGDTVSIRSRFETEDVILKVE